MAAWPLRKEPSINQKACPRCKNSFSSPQRICPICGWELDKTWRNLEASAVRCPTCGGRVAEGESRCPICGAQPARTASLAGRLPHILLAAALLSLLLIASLWFLEPTLGSAPQATLTATFTRTAWSSPTPKGTATRTPTASLTPTTTPTPLCISYTVGEKDTLSSLADRFFLSAAEIARNNGLISDGALKVGQKLCIPAAPKTIGSLTPLPTATPTRHLYVVEKGDNLDLIAGKFSVTVSALLAANKLSSEGLLMIGQELVIPSLEPLTPTPVRASPTVTATTIPPTPTATRTSTPLTLIYPPIEPLSPLPGSIFHGPEAQVMLSWAAADQLGPEDWYIIHLYQVQSGNTLLAATVWSKGTSWRVPRDLYPEAANDSHTFQWDILIARQIGKEEWVALSPSGRISYFFWY